MEATYGTPIEENMLASKLVDEAWYAVLDWSFSNSDEEKDQHDMELKNLRKVRD